jgi:hypothetical protein
MTSEVHLKADSRVPEPKSLKCSTTGKSRPGSKSPSVNVAVKKYNNSNSNASKGDACLWQRTRIKKNLQRFSMPQNISHTIHMPHKSVTESGPTRPRPPDLWSVLYMTRLIEHRKLDPGSVESSDSFHSRRPRTWEGASLHPQVADEQP